MAKKVYIAGPFFNPQQVEQVARIENVLESAGVDFFSPRLQHGGGTGVKQPVPTVGSRDMAERVFRKNFEEIEDCTAMLAVLDYLLPPGDGLALVNGGNVQRFLSLPDTGTIWEMGVAYGQGIPVTGFMVSPQSYMNLMLTQSMHGVITSYEMLRESAEEMRTKRDHLKGPDWTGSYR